MRQTRLESFLEATINVASGFVVAMVVNWLVVIPLWSLDWTFFDNLGVTFIFTTVAVARSYFWRRFFDAEIHKIVHGRFKA